MSDQSVSIGALSLRHPFILGSGPIGVRADDLIAYGQVAGAIITKSISVNPSRGSPQPRIVKMDRDGMINYEGGPNPGIEAFAATLREVRSAIPCPIIGSVSPRTLTQAMAIETMTEKFVDAGADGLELDFKYLYDQDKGKAEFLPEKMTSIIRRVRATADVPVIASWPSAPSRSTSSLVPPKTAARRRSRPQHRIPAMRIGLRARRPTLSMNFGGLSGAPIRPLAVAGDIPSAPGDKPAIDRIGGIVSAEDAAEFFLAGANAVQVYTTAQIQGPAIFPELVTGLEKVLVDMKAASLAEIVGAAHKAAVRRQDDHQWDAIGG